MKTVALVFILCGTAFAPPDSSPIVQGTIGTSQVQVIWTLDDIKADTAFVPPRMVDLPAPAIQRMDTMATTIHDALKSAQSSGKKSILFSVIDGSYSYGNDTFDAGEATFRGIQRFIDEGGHMDRITIGSRKLIPRDYIFAVESHLDNFRDALREAETRIGEPNAVRKRQGWSALKTLVQNHPESPEIEATLQALSGDRTPTWKKPSLTSKKASALIKLRTKLLEELCANGVSKVAQ